MRDETKLKLLIGAVVLLLVAACSWDVFYSRCTVESVTVNVTKTERITEGSGETISSKYLVFSDKETFENSDCIWHGKFNSSDLQGKLTPGRYTLTVYGWRIPFFSSYRNIIKVRKST